jgi:hypothetical protein
MHPAGEDGFFKAKCHKQLLLGRPFPAAEELTAATVNANLAPGDRNGGDSFHRLKTTAMAAFLASSPRSGLSPNSPSAATIRYRVVSPLVEFDQTKAVPKGIRKHGQAAVGCFTNLAFLNGSR